MIIRPKKTPSIVTEREPKKFRKLRGHPCNPRYDPKSPASPCKAEPEILGLEGAKESKSIVTTKKKIVYVASATKNFPEKEYREQKSKKKVLKYHVRLLRYVEVQITENFHGLIKRRKE